MKDLRKLCEEAIQLWDADCDMDGVINEMRTALAQPEPQGAPKNCWLDDELDLLPTPCVFDDPSDVVENCVYAQQVKCKTDCKYYRQPTRDHHLETPND